MRHTLQSPKRGVTTMLANNIADPMVVKSMTIGVLLAHAVQWVEPVTNLINESYLLGESGMWVEGAMRTNVAEIQELLLQKRIIVAFDQQKLLGCIKITKADVNVLEFGQLAVSKGSMRSGVATQLIQYVENYARHEGFSKIKLEILYPAKEFEQILDESEYIDMTDPLVFAWKKKALLHKIYMKMNYQKSNVGDMSEFALDYPQLVNSLAIACKYVVYEKSLDDTG